MSGSGPAGLRRTTVMVVSHEASRTGAPKVAVHLLAALRAAGAHTLVLHRWGGPMREELDRAADESRTEPAARLRVLLRRWQPTKGLAWRLERWAVGRALDRVGPDVVWCNTVLASVYAPFAAQRGIPCVVYSHEGRQLAEQALSRAELLATSPPVEPAPTLVGCSTDTAEILADLRGQPGTAQVLHSPVDAEAVCRAASLPSPPSSAGLPRVVAVGKGDVGKGIGVFNDAAALGAHLGCDWVWVGDVPPQLRVPGVEYVGELASAAPSIAGAAVFVLPSLLDSFPLVVLEAMALSRPIVASRLPGTVEQLADTAVLIDPGDAAALVEGVRGFLDDPDRAAALGSAAADRCREMWDLSAFDRRVEEILGSILRTEVR